MDWTSKEVGAKYWEWTRESGWTKPVTIGTFPAPYTGNLVSTAGLIRHNRDTWYMYFVEGESEYLSAKSSATLKYFKSIDGGKTWGPLEDTGLPAHYMRSHVSFARYGDNYYVFLCMNNNTVVYYSKDAENWEKGSERVVAEGVYFKPCGTLLHQSALIFTANPARTARDDQYGIITTIPELISAPGAPTDPSPANGGVLEVGTNETELAVKVHGPQTYDVAFYWEDGTFIAEDKLLREGDTARVNVTDLAGGKTYKWYAVARGALLEYYGCEPDKTSDEKRSDAFGFTCAEISQ